MSRAIAIANLSAPYINVGGYSGYMLDLNAAVYSSLTFNGSNVSAWADQSGAGNNASQGTTNDQPGYAAAGLNGQPCLTFNGTSQYIKTVPLSAAMGVMFVVAKATTQSGTARYITSDGTPAAHSLYESSATQMSAGTVGGSKISVTANATVPHVYAVLFNGSSSAFYIDGAATSGTTSAETTSAMYIGVGSALWDGPIARILAYSTALADAQIRQIGAFLAWQYSIAGTW